MKRIALIIFLNISGLIIAQENIVDVSILKSDVIKEKKETTIQSIKKDSNGNIYVFRYYDNNKKFLIDKFTSKLKKIKSYEFNPKRGNIICGAFLEGNRIGFIEYRKNIKKHIVINYEAYAHTSNLESLNFESRKIFEFTPDIYPNFFNKLLSMPFKGNLTFSRTGEFLVFNIDSDEENYKILVFDKDFNKVWENEFKLLYGDRKSILQSVRVSDNGDVFVMFIMNFKKRKKKEKDNYHYEIVKLTKDNKITKKLNQGEDILSLKLEISPENEIACLGFYSDKKEKQVKGFCSFILNFDDLKSKNEVFTPFSYQFLKDISDRELNDIRFKKIFFTNDSNIMIHAEENYITNFHNAHGNYISRTNFDNIITLNVNKNGELVWAKNINKVQILNNSNFSLISYGAMNIKSEQYLLLNSNKKMGGLSGKKIRIRENFLWNITKNNSSLYLGKFDKGGNFTYKSLLNNKDEEVVFNTRYAKQISDNEVILFGHKRKKTQFLKLTFN